MQRRRRWRRAWEGPLHGTSRGAALGRGASTGGWRWERCWDIPKRNAVPQGNLQPSPWVAQGGSEGCSSCCRGTGMLQGKQVEEWKGCAKVQSL